MKTQTLLDKYKSQSRAARELTRRGLPITRQAIQQWGETVPYRTACIIETVTNGRLRVDRGCYQW